MYDHANYGDNSEYIIYSQSVMKQMNDLHIMNIRNSEKLVVAQ